MHLFSGLGYVGIFFVVGVESIGIPLPGETTLVAAAIIAGTTHKFNIIFVIIAAIAGAIIGDNIGFLIGKQLGHTFLRRFGKRVGINESKLKLGQYLFMKYGGNIVFFGRFISLLRVLAALLAGVNNMPWKRFLLYNAAGAIAWSFIYGSAGYLLGRNFHKLHWTLRVGGISLGIIILVSCVLFIRKNEKRLEKEAEKAMPGPIEKYQ